MSPLTNMGKASIKVNILNSLPNVAKDKNIFDFDLHADLWPALQSLGVAFPPAFLESFIDKEKGFSTFFPLKRRYPVDNFITDGQGVSATASKSTKPYILWKPTIAKDGIINNLVTGKTTNKTPPFDSYTLQYPPAYTPDENYRGPKWIDNAYNGEPPPNDMPIIQEWIKTLRSGGQTVTPTTTTGTTTAGAIPTTYYINQTVVRDGLWWGIESTPFLNENTPFWVVINKALSPPTNNHETFLVISLGIDDDNNAFDFYVSSDKKPMMFDYTNGRKASAGTQSGEPPHKMQEFPEDFSKLWATDGHLEIGFMTVAGKLAIFFNKTKVLYTRINSGDKLDKGNTSGTIREAKIGKGRIRIYGSNCQMNINVCPMTFVPMGVAALPLPVIQSDGKTVEPKWSGVDYKMEASGSIAKMPKEPSKKEDSFGLDCATFNFEGGTGSSDIKGFGAHKQGTINLRKATSLGVTSAAANDYYILDMQPSSLTLNLGTTPSVIPYSGCPYFFRLKGKYEIPPTGGGGGGTDISSDVFSVTEQYQIDDYFVISGTATVVLYNKGGKYDAMKLKQKGIELSWGWNGNVIKTFTGIITGVSSSEVPGKEELTLTCSDYMFLLKNTQMFNSPYYDGMVLFYASRDIIRRAGIVQIINDWDNTDDYYLPSGYAFTKPAVQFENTSMLYDCVKSMVERAEAVFYFDQDGACHLKKLPGGLFSTGASDSNVMSFSRNPISGVNTILDTKNVEYDYSETVNRISIWSLDRESRDGIMYTKSAKGSEDNLIYRRLFYIEQAALGRENVVRAYADELAQRAFYPIRKTSFKTVGSSQIVYPLSFVTVDGLEYRITGLSRKYEAANNDFTNEYNCEWLGGK